MQTVKEKLTFKLRETVDVGGENGSSMQVDLYVKCSVNFEKSTYKVTPVITTQHGTDAAFFKSVAAVSHAAAVECKKELDLYAASIPGGGVQGELDLRVSEYDNEARAAA